MLNLIRSEKRKYFKNLSFSSERKNNFWKVCKPLLSSKYSGETEKIHLINENVVVSEDLVITNIFNQTFTSDAVHSLNIKPWVNQNTPISMDPVKKAIHKYSNHPSVMKIKQSNIYFRRSQC